LVPSLEMRNLPASLGGLEVVAQALQGGRDSRGSVAWAARVIFSAS
jgi:hypothetical protein